MTAGAEIVTVREQRVKVKAGREIPQQVARLSRGRVLMTRRCQLCGRVRTVYGTFGICRTCWGNLGGAGLIPGVQKAKW